MQHSVALRNMFRLKWLSFAVVRLERHPILANPFVIPAHVVTVGFSSDLCTLCKTNTMLMIHILYDKLAIFGLL